jgi:hypothetical protein
LAETLLKSKCGAPSLIAATRLSQTWLNNDLIKALFDALWGNVIPTFSHATASYPMRYSRLGDILNYAKLYLPIKKEESRFVKDHLEIYHVIGDPTLELWKTMPQTVRLGASLRNGELLILMQDDHDVMLPACPADAVITVWDGKDCIKRLAPMSTHLTLSLRDAILSPTLPEISVCFWAPGYRFCQKNVRG